MPSPKESTLRTPEWFDPADEFATTRMRQYAAITAAEAKLAAAMEKALTGLLAAIRSGGGYTGEGTVFATASARLKQRWRALIAQFVIGVVEALFTEAFDAQVVTITVRGRPRALRRLAMFLEAVYAALDAWPQQILDAIDAEERASREAEETPAQRRSRIEDMLRITAPSPRLARQIQGLLRTIADPGTSEAVRRQARSRLAALRRRTGRKDSRWWPKLSAAGRVLSISALNGGTNAGIDAYVAATGEKKYKQWWSLEDNRVRLAHKHAHGQIRAAGKPFDVGGFPMFFPGDPAAPADLVVNCRCALNALTAKQVRGRTTHAAGFQTGGLTMGPSIVIHKGDGGDGIAALPLLADGADMDEKHSTVKWRGVLAPLGVRSGDNRMLAMPEPGAQPQTRDLPLPLLYMEKTGNGHDNSVVVGRIDRVWFENDALMGEGVIDLGNDTAREVTRLIDGGYHRWVSIRVDNATSEYQLYRGDQLLDASEFEVRTDGDTQVIPEDVEEVEVATKWRLMNAAIVAEPAFQEAVIGLVDDEDEDTEENEGEGTGGPGEDDDEFAKKDKKPEPDDKDDGKDEDKAKGGKNIPPWLRKKKDMSVSTTAPIFAALLASAAPVRPPGEWFEDPGLERPTPLTVSDDGRIFGHVAVWNTAHVGYPKRRVTPPRDCDYSLFHHGYVRTAEDRDIAVGTIVLGADHAAVDAHITEATLHYAHSGYGVAVVRAGEDEHGVWISGAVCPDVDEVRLAALRRCSLSGDWRGIDGKARFIAALAVNVPGFPTPREQTDEHGVTTALVAAGALAQESRETPNAYVALDPASAREWAREAFSELRRLEEAEKERARLAVEFAALQKRMAAPKVAAMRRRVVGAGSGR